MIYLKNKNAKLKIIIINKSKRDFNLRNSNN